MFRARLSSAISTTLPSVAALGLLVGSAAALEVNSSVTVAGTPDAVWQKIGDFCAIQTWHPAIASCEQRDEGGETYRTLTTADGAKIEEKLVEKTETSYTYEILDSPLPVNNYRATLSVAPEGEGTRVDWRGTFDAKDASDDDAKGVMSGIYQAGLDEIAATSGN
jgi:hypothetical protein